MLTDNKFTAQASSISQIKQAPHSACYSGLPSRSLIKLTSLGSGVQLWCKVRCWFLVMKDHLLQIEALLVD